jgi:uncharacterized membrane protein YhaH (DUF805 family)
LGPVEAISTCLRKAFQFNGRASIAEYWWFAAFATLLPSLLYSVKLDKTSQWSAGIVLSLVFLCPLLAAGCRRFQDTGQSKWSFLAAFLSSLLLAIVAYDPTTMQRSDITATSFLAFGVSVAILFWTFWILIASSTPGPNRYGPNPLEVTP